MMATASWSCSIADAAHCADLCQPRKADDDCGLDKAAHLASHG